MDSPTFSHGWDKIMLRSIRSLGWCLSMLLMRSVTVLVTDVQQRCGNLTSLLKLSLISNGNSELILQHTRQMFCVCGNKISKKFRMKSSLLGWSTLWKCSSCRIFCILSLVHCSWGVDLKSVIAAFCVYLPMYNSLTWLSEWVSKWVSHSQTDIPTRLPCWWRFRKTVFPVRCPPESEERVEQWKRPWSSV